MSMIKPRPMPPFPKPSGSFQKRHKGLRRGKPMRKRSVAKTLRHHVYVAALVFLIYCDPLCRRCRRRRATEGHHPWGQLGAKIFIFWPFCRQCHDEVENNKKKARAEGWILYK
jgi:hypothetical protein